MRGEVLLVILGMAAISYAIRAAGMLAGTLLPNEGRAAAALAQLPAAILIALVAPMLIHGGPAEWTAAVIVALIAARWDNLLLPLAVGTAAVAVLRGL